MIFPPLEKCPIASGNAAKPVSPLENSYRHFISESQGNREERKSDKLFASYNSYSHI
jgi:hypothetical protein